MEETVLVKKAKLGDKDALVQLIMNQKNDYYRLAYVYLKNNEDALDAMEDMILILYENIYTLKKNSAFYSWSKTILINCCKRILREQKRTVPLETVKELSYEGDFEEKNNEMLLEKYLSELDERHQEVIKLRYLLDLDYKTIAVILKVPLGTIKSRIYYGISRLQEKFGGDDLEQD
ncbi:RNA polymerase sigma factor [Anaerosolibacter sp.]|uniref:RNA polymerase sigma factor n=1 Tax=Anaerosolibacter sp. TaxID=1872527 RepID=UPI0039F029B0